MLIKLAMEILRISVICNNCPLFPGAEQDMYPYLRWMRAGALNPSYTLEEKSTPRDLARNEAY